MNKKTCKTRTKVITHVISVRKIVSPNYLSHNPNNIN